MLVEVAVLNTGLFLLSWSPVVLLTVLTVLLRRSAIELSVYGLLFSLILAMGFFNTSPVVAAMAAVDGILTTLPLLLVVAAGIFLSSLLMATGSLNRIVEWFKAGAGEAFAGNMLITFGVGNFMEGSGVIAEPVVAPMLHAAGVSSTGSAALSVIGYAGLMTLELAGIIVTVLALVTGLPVKELGVAAAWLSIPATLLMALCLPFFLPQRAWRVRRLTVVLFSGLLLGTSGLVAAVFVGISVSGTLAGLAVIFAFILFGSGRLRMKQGIFVDLVPFVFLLVCLLLVNSVPYLRKLTFEQLVIKVHFIQVHAVTFRPLFSAYLYIFLAFLISIRLQRGSQRAGEDRDPKRCEEGLASLSSHGAFRRHGPGDFLYRLCARLFRVGHRPQHPLDHLSGTGAVHWNILSDVCSFSGLGGNVSHRLRCGVTDAVRAASGAGGFAAGSVRRMAFRGVGRRKLGRFHLVAVQNRAGHSHVRGYRKGGRHPTVDHTLGSGGIVRNRPGGLADRLSWMHDPGSLRAAFC